NRVRQLLLVVDAGDLERADAYAVVGDAQPDALLRQVVRGEELLQRLRERVRVAELAADDDPRLERRARGLQQLGGAVVRNPRGGELRCAALQARDLLRATAAARRLDLRLLLLALLRRLCRLGLLRLLRLLRLLLAADLLLPERNLLLRRRLVDDG